jgi:hypothetical protein
MKRLVLTLAAMGLAAGLSATPSNAAILFTFDVGVNAPVAGLVAGDNTAHGPYVYGSTFSSVTVPGTPDPTTTYTIIPNATVGGGIFTELDASGTGSDIVLANNQLFATSATPDTFNFGYSFNLRVFKDDNPADFADFFINGQVTGSNVKKGSATTTNTYLSTIPQGAVTALSGTQFFLTRLDFTFPQAPPLAGGPGTPGAFSAHIQAIPEPGPVAFLSGILVAGSALRFRRKRMTAV